MKKIILFFSAVIFTASFGFAQVKKEKTEKVEKKKEVSASNNGQPSEADMKSWMDYMTPGEAHKMLASCNGEWDGDITMWMAPGAPAMKSKGTSTNEMIMDGRYQLGKYKGDFNGMPFEGMSLVGYDNIKKVFESTWIDNIGTGTMHLEGPWDAKTKTITLTGTMTDPMKKNQSKVKETLQIVDEDTQVMKMYAYEKGKEFQTMEITYRRKK